MHVMKSSNSLFHVQTGWDWRLAEFNDPKVFREAGLPGQILKDDITDENISCDWYNGKQYDIYVSYDTYVDNSI